MYWWSLFRTIAVVLSVGAVTQRSSQICSHKLDDQTSTFLRIVGLSSEKSCGLVPSPGKWRKPVCKESTGCDIPLNCFNYSTLTNKRLLRAIKVDTYNLELILEDSSTTNSCVVVMFYVPWCPYSTDFARQFNALGRSFKELAVLAVDFSESDPYKYLTAYLPLVNFYYNSKVVYRFKATESYDELLQQVSAMTSFYPIAVDLADVENELPVPTVRADGDTVYLIVATCWVLFVAAVYLYNSKLVTKCFSKVMASLWRT